MFWSAYSAAFAMLYTFSKVMRFDRSLFCYSLGLIPQTKCYHSSSRLDGLQNHKTQISFSSTTNSANYSSCSPSPAVGEHLCITVAVVIELWCSDISTLISLKVFSASCLVAAIFLIKLYCKWIFHTPLK